MALSWLAGASPVRFVDTTTLSQRIEEASRVRERYQDRIPVICEKTKKSKDIPDLDKSKFLVPGDLTVGQLVYVIRSRLSLPSETALFVYDAATGNALPTSALMRDVDQQNKSADGFLYINYAGEATFG